MLNKSAAVFFATAASTIFGFAISVLFYWNGVNGLPWLAAAYFLSGIGAVFGLCTALVISLLDNGVSHSTRDYAGFGISTSLLLHAVAVVLDWQHSSGHIVENLIAAILTGTVIGLGYAFGRWTVTALRRSSKD